MSEDKTNMRMVGKGGVHAEHLEITERIPGGLEDQFRDLLLVFGI